jgi:hypothetical protein
VRGTVDYKGDYRTAATAWRDRQFFYYTEWKHPSTLSVVQWASAMCECTRDE